MSYMLEVYYRRPFNPAKETSLNQYILERGGQLSFREEPEEEQMGSICLTSEFESRAEAEAAAESLRRQGEHVEAPMESCFESTGTTF